MRDGAKSWNMERSRGKERGEGGGMEGGGLTMADAFVLLITIIITLISLRGNGRYASLAYW